MFIVKLMELIGKGVGVGAREVRKISAKNAGKICREFADGFNDGLTGVNINPNSPSKWARLKEDFKAGYNG